MSHQEPAEDDACQICYCPIDEETYCEYKTHATDAVWSPSKLCLDCIQFLQSSQWERHLELVKKIDCRRAAIEVCRSVPLYVHERAVFICPTHGADECPNKGQIEQLWTKVNDIVIAPILDNAKQGEEREKYIQHLEKFAELFEADKEADIAAMQQGADGSSSPLQSQQDSQQQSQYSQSQTPSSPSYPPNSQ